MNLTFALSSRKPERKLVGCIGHATGNLYTKRAIFGKCDVSCVITSENLLQGMVNSGSSPIYEGDVVTCEIQF